MTPEHEALWRRIEGFAFDDPLTSLPFSARLAKDNGWSRDFARRVIDEYRRFAFLAVAAGHPVSPSDAVDQAWHEHLVYTRSYWDEFCGQVLGRPLHHAPTRGGAAEAAKFADWYARTLASYRKFFDTEPPADIWPTPEQRARTEERFARVNLAENWVVPKPRARSARWPAIGAGLLGLTGCSGLVAATFWPFDLPGPEFMQVFTALAVAAFIVALFWRHRLRSGGREGAERAPDPGALPIALLAGGSLRAMVTTIADMQRRGLVKAQNKGTERRLYAMQPLPPEATELERLVYHVANEGAGAEWLAACEAGSDLLAPAVDRLRQQGLVLEETQVARARFQPLVPLGIVLLIGVGKILVGLSRNRPVEYLVVGCILLLFLAAALASLRPWRTLAGDRVLARLQADHASLKAPRRFLPSNVPDFAVAVALFGAVALPDTMEDMKLWFTSTGTSGGGDGSSGCGGGGGGGGGCGGCSGH